MLDHAHADAAEGFQPRDQIHDLLFRVDELHDRVVQAARRRHAQIAAHFPVGELQIWASARREKKRTVDLVGVGVPVDGDQLSARVDA